MAATDSDAGLIVAPATASPAPPDAGVKDDDEAILAAIRVLSENERAVPRAVVDRILERLPELTRGARIVPEMINGQAVGIRVFGVRADNLLGRLAFQNGDRLERIAGQSVTSPDKVLETYAALRVASQVDLDVVRRGQPVRIVIRIE